MTTGGVIKVGPYELDEVRYFAPDTHLWAAPTSATRVRCGFDPLGAETCGDIVALSFEAPGTRLARGDAFGYVEAAKFVGPLLAPVAGVITGHNPEPLANPVLLNSDPMEHWMVELESPVLESDLRDLVHGRSAVADWFTRELARLERQGMIAE